MNDVHLKNDVSFHIITLNTKKAWNDVLQVGTDRKIVTSNSHHKIDGERTFQDKHKLRKFMLSKPTAQRIMKEYHI